MKKETDKTAGFCAWEGLWWGAVLVLAYAAVVLLPLALAARFHPHGEHNFLGELGKSFALAGFTILALQFVIAARLRWVERPFGLDLLFRHHKTMAVFALVLLLSHPFLIAAGESEWELLYSLDLPWRILIAKFALLLLLVQAASSLLRQPLRLGYEKWRLLHNLALLIFGLALVHSWGVGSDLQLTPLRAVWVALAAAVVISYGFHKFLVPRRARRKAYRVTDIKRETHNVWTLRMEPPAGQRRLEYRPGQFAFIRLWRAQRGLPVEEHHFTISSSPTQPDLSMTIKESGDFTATIGETRAGDLVSVQGPFGRFSHTLHPGIGRELVFIAGGIGITPLMSMLRYMGDTRAELDVLLLYGNRTEADIVFREEVEQIAAGERPHLRVVHVLGRPPEQWPGESGFVDREKIQRLVGEGVVEKSYYLCGPAPMAKMVLSALRELRVPPQRIAYERFWL